MHVFDTVTGKNELKVLKKDLSCEKKCKFEGWKKVGKYGRKCN